MIGKISRFELTIRVILLVVFFLFFMFPIYWMVATSFKNTVDIFSIPPKWFFKISAPEVRLYRPHIVKQYLRIGVDDQFAGGKCIPCKELGKTENLSCGIFKQKRLGPWGGIGHSPGLHPG